jgi:hypothetical protein
MIYNIMELRQTVLAVRAASQDTAFRGSAPCILFLNHAFRGGAQAVQTDKTV